MAKKTSIAKWKLPIIRWALRELAPLLPALASISYEGLARFGIDDLHKNEFTGDYALYPSAEKYMPEPIDPND